MSSNFIKQPSHTPELTFEKQWLSSSRMITLGNTKVALSLSKPL